MTTAIGSCDLSEVCEHGLEVTIEGKGTLNTDFGVPMTLEGHVTHVHVILTGKATTHENPTHSPWEVVSFDREACKLVVKQARKPE
jgi:hypothetical protein